MEKGKAEEMTKILLLIRGPNKHCLIFINLEMEYGHSITNYYPIFTSKKV